MSPNMWAALPAIAGCLLNAFVWGVINENVKMTVASLLCAAFSVWLGRRY